MRFWRFIFPLLLIPLLLARPPLARAQSGITYPPETEVLRGTIKIQGSAIHGDFWKYELAAAPQGTQNWFNIAASESQINNNVLGVWDTRSVADGPYTIRLRVVRRDGNYDEFYVQKVMVANAAPVATPTPATTPTPTITPTPKPPTATPVRLTPEIPTPTPAPTAMPNAGAAAGSQEEDDDNGDDADQTDRTSEIMALLATLKDALLKGAFYVTLAFLVVGAFFGIKTLLQWLYVRFFLK